MKKPAFRPGFSFTLIRKTLFKERGWVHRRCVLADFEVNLRTLGTASHAGGGNRLTALNLLAALNIKVGSVARKP